jgi:Domain of unknown function (DUF4340)
MSQTRLLILVLAAIVALAGGWYFGTATEPIEQVAMNSGKLMFPGLVDKLKDARKIEITNQGKTTVIALKNGVWGLAERDDYPVLDSKLHGMLTALTELRLVAPRTSNRDEFRRLGLENPTKDKTGTANLLRILDKTGTPILSLITGHRRVRARGDLPAQLYVRRPGVNRTWLAEGGLDVESDPQVWLDRNVMNIAANKIIKVVSTRGDTTIALARDGKVLKVVSPATTPKLADYRLDDVAHALEYLTFEDVKRADKPLGVLAGSAVFTTVDGLEIHVTVHHLDKDSWSRFTVVAPDRGKAEADRLNKKLTGWAFETGAWKDKSLIPALTDLEAPAPAKPAASRSPIPAKPAAAAPSATPAKSTAAVPAQATPPATAPAESAAAAQAKAPATTPAKPATAAKP